MAQDRLDGLSLLAIERDAAAAQKLDMTALQTSLQSLKLESQNSTKTLFTGDYVVTCESVHL